MRELCLSSVWFSEAMQAVQFYTMHGIILLDILAKKLYKRTVRKRRGLCILHRFQGIYWHIWRYNPAAESPMPRMACELPSSLRPRAVDACSSNSASSPSFHFPRSPRPYSILRGGFPAPAMCLLSVVYKYAWYSQHTVNYHSNLKVGRST